MAPQGIRKVLWNGKKLENNKNVTCQNSKKDADECQFFWEMHKMKWNRKHDMYYMAPTPLEPFSVNTFTYIHVN